MTKKEIDEMEKDPVKFAQRYFSDEVYALEKTIKELKREMREEAKRNIIIDDPIDYSMIKFLKLHDPNRFGEELITNKKEKKMTVKKAVRDLIVSNPYPFDKITGEINQQGISNWKIEHAHPRHQMSGLRELRSLRAEYYVVSSGSFWTAYFIIANRYYIQYGFRKWLEENYRD